MIDPETFRTVLGRFATGVTVVTIRDGAGRDHGMTVSAFSSVSLVPPLVMVCIGHASDMYPFLSGVDRFGASILSASQEVLSRRFSEAIADRFEGVAHRRGSSGVALLDDAIATLECTIVARHPAGDHTIVVGRVEHGTAGDAAPLLYYRSGYARLER